MPEDVSPVRLPEVNLDSEPFKFGTEVLGQAYALSLVTQTFDNYENFRAQYHDTRWNVSDTLYYGWLPAKTWEGTSVPRASLGDPIVFDQVEAALPAICQEIFVPQDEWFQVETEPGSNVDEARAVQEHMSYVLEHSKNDYGLSARNEIELAIKSTLLYGNGGISLEYDPILRRPVVSWVDIRDFYIDPGCPVPSVDESRAVIRRKMYTVNDLIILREDPRMNIPGDDVLYHLASNPLFAVGDQTKRNAESIRGVPFTPNVTDYAVNPADRKIEVLIYNSNSKIIWVLGRQLVIYNEDNPYGFISYCFAPCYTVPGRFYAQSIADVQEGNQRYIEALLNARLDALSLELNPPRVYKAGVLMTPAQLKWRPGLLAQAADAKDMSLLQNTTQTAGVFNEIAFIKDAAEGRTGINSMTSGIPRPSNTNRTATGVSAVSSGTASRLRELVSNFENYLIVPMLYKLYEIIRLHSQPDSQLSGISKTGNLTNISSNNFQKKMRFRMLASSKMMTREKLAAVFPFLAQYMLNGTFLGELQKSGKTIDFLEMFHMLRDATGTGRLYNFIRDMNPQEQQAMKQPPPEVLAQQQQSQAELQTRMQLGQLKSQTDLQKAQIMQQPPPPDPQELQQEQVRFQMDMEREQQRLRGEQLMQQIKTSAEVQKNQMNAQAKQQELHMKQQELGMNLHATQAEHSMNMQQMLQQNAMERETNAASHAQELEHGQEVHKQDMVAARDKASMAKQEFRRKAEVRKKEKGPK